MVHVHVTPKASRPGVGPVTAGADGAAVVKARVAAAPEDGKANAELLRAMAREWRLPKSAIQVASGTAARHKTVRIHGDPAELLPRLAAWAEAHRG